MATQQNTELQVVWLQMPSRFLRTHPWYGDLDFHSQRSTCSNSVYSLLETGGGVVTLHTSLQYVSCYDVYVTCVSNALHSPLQIKVRELLQHWNKGMFVL